MAPLSSAQIEAFAEAGALATSGVLPAELVAQAADEAAAAAARFAFPSRDAPAVNALSLSAELAAAARQLLGTAEVRLCESLVFPPGHESEGLPRIAHHDGGDGKEPDAAAPLCRQTALLDPPSAGAEAVHIEIALSEDRLGEVTFTRSSAERPPPASAAQRCCFRRADVEWGSGENAGWGVSVSGMPRDWVPSLTVAQRGLLGVPPPGSDCASSINRVLLSPARYFLPQC